MAQKKPKPAREVEDYAHRAFRKLPTNQNSRFGQQVNFRLRVNGLDEHLEAYEFLRKLSHGEAPDTMARAILLYKDFCEALAEAEKQYGDRALQGWTLTDLLQAAAEGENEDGEN